MRLLDAPSSRHRRGGLAPLAFLWLYVAFLPHARAANSYDPALTYCTVYSPHFAVHYPPGGRNLGVRIMRLAEEVLQADSALFGYRPPGRIEVVLSDQQDDANGSAQVAPKNILRLYLAAPVELTGLAAYDDWLRTLLTHELAHICDLDHTEGANRGLRHIFGKWIAPNAYVPQLWSEGVAVFAETELTDLGRGRSSYVEMLLRMAALDGTFLSIDQANSLWADWPGGNAPYFYGGRFHLYLAQRLGRHAVAAMHTHLAGQVLPYVYEGGALAVFGATLPRLWADFYAEERAVAKDVARSVVAHGVTPSRALTHHGRYIAAARFRPDGRGIVYSRQSPVDGPTLRMMDNEGGGDHFLGLDTLSARLAFSADGASLYFSKAAITHRFDNYSDLYRYDFKSGRSRRLYDVAAPKMSLRARDPAVSADGREIVFVRNHLHQSYLAAATFDVGDPVGLHVRTLVGPSADMQYASPALSPDGATLAASVQFAGGYRDLVLLDAHTGAHRQRLTKDRALDGNPTFSPDGRYVIYDSDADGITNLYAFDTHAGTYARITHVVGGAFQPDVSPDGRNLLFRNASGRGFDIHTMAFDPNSWEPVAYDPNGGYTPVSTVTDVTSAAADAQAAFPTLRLRAPGAAPEAWRAIGVGPSVPRAAEAPLTLAAGETEGPYTPWRTLLPFQENWNLTPSLYLLNNDPFVSLMTVGQDALQRHTYKLTLETSYYGRHANVSMSYAYDGLRPTLSLRLSDEATTYRTADGRAVLINRMGSVAMRWPFYNRHSVLLRYTFSHLTGNTLAPVVSALGPFGSVSMGYGYAFAHRFAYSVGLEQGRAVSVSLTHYAPAYGSDYAQLLASLDGRLYVNNPLADNHVLALRLAANYAIGRDSIQNFFLYGSQGTSVLTAQTGQLFPLRGFVPGVGPYGAPRPGTGLMAAYAEYRFPLWHIQRGFYTAPIYLQRLHAAVFADAGTTFDRVTGNRGVSHVSLGGGLAHIWASTGAEVRLDMVFGWIDGLTLRGGVAVPTVVAGAPAGRLHIVPYLDVGTAL